jgi:(R,R)-butanediol dehydrogenase / meso-butanediol dehydrogenase / diacetyl reductase
MLAARWYGRRDVRVEEVDDLGTPRPGWVRLRIEACGICGTDVEEYSSGPVVIPRTPNRLSGQAAPLTLGHEAVGVVVETGDGVTMPVGTRVAVESNLYCGECVWCVRDETQLCPDLASLGLMGDGGLAEQMLAPAELCLPYGDHVPAEHAALAEPLSVALRAMRRGRVRPGDSVGIIGAGTIGLLAVQAARVAGASHVMVVERVPERRELALALGASAACGPEQSAEAVRDLTGGAGPDVVFEAAGNAPAAAAAIRLARRGGRAVLLGVFAGDVAFDMVDFLFGEKEIVASLSHVVDDDFTRAVRLIDDGAVQIAPLVTDRIGLPDVVAAGFEALIAHPSAHLKIVVTLQRPTVRRDADG